MNKVITIARYTFLEAVRNRLFPVAIAGLICLLGIAEFIGELAITETRAVQVAILAYIARWFFVLTTALFVITSMVREFNDKGVELMLSLPSSRIVYYAGKFSGFIILALVVLLALSPVLLLYTDPVSLSGWCFSLMCETAILIALSMLCLFTFSNITIAFLVVVSFYILARNMAAMQLLGTSPILESQTPSQEFMNTMINLVAYVLPDLHRFTGSDWLVYGAGADQLWFVFLQTAIFLAILIPAGLFDLLRKEI